MKFVISAANTAHHAIKPITYSYKEHNFIINQPAVWCNSCGERVITPEDNKTVQAEIQTHKSKIDGLLAPVEIEHIRKKLKLTQKDASVLFGGGVNAFNRYEKGVNPIPKPLSLLLTILGNHPEQLREIKGSQ